MYSLKFACCNTLKKRHSSLTLCTTYVMYLMKVYMVFIFECSMPSCLLGVYQIKSPLNRKQKDIIFNFIISLIIFGPGSGCLFSLALRFIWNNISFGRFNSLFRENKHAVNHDVFSAFSLVPRVQNVLHGAWGHLIGGGRTDPGPSSHIRPLNGRAHCTTCDVINLKCQQIFLISKW